MRRITRKPRTDETVDRTGNRYCGPLVLAALGIGANTAEAAAAVCRATGNDRTIKGMHNHEMLTTLCAHGFRVSDVDVPMVYMADRRPGQTLENCVQRTSGRSFVTFGRERPYGRHGGCWTERRDLCEDETEAQHTPVKRCGVTFAAWLRQRPDKSAVYLVNVTRHYVLVSGRKFVDTFTKGEWVGIGKAPHRRKRVGRVWKLTR